MRYGVGECYALANAWEMFIAKHNDEEEAQDLEQRRRAAVVAQPSERRNRRQGNEASRIEPRGVTSMPSSDAARTLICRERMPPGRHRPSECSGGFPHRVRDEFFAMQGVHRRRTRAIRQCLLYMSALIAAVDLCNTRRVRVDRGRRGTGLSSTFSTQRYCGQKL